MDDFTQPDNTNLVLSGGAPAPAPVQDNGVVHQIPTPDAPPPAVMPSPTGQVPAGFVQGDTVPAKPKSKWEMILTGALVGLAGGMGQKSFGGGLSAGAKSSLDYAQQQRENEQRQEEIDTRKRQTESTIRFQSAQSANLAAETAVRDAQLHALPAELQMKADAHAVELMKTLQDMGITPTLSVNNNTGGTEAKAGLEQLTQTHNGVPPLFSVVMGKQIVSYDLNQLAGQPQGLEQVNKIRGITNQQPIDTGMWAKLPQTSKVQQTNEALNFWNPAPTEANYQSYANYLKTAKAQPSTPEQAATVTKLQSTVDFLKSAIDAGDARDTRKAVNRATAVAEAQGKVFDDYNRPPDMSQLERASSKSILAQTGLSGGAFAYLVGDGSQLPRDKVTRARAISEATKWAVDNNIDTSTFRAQYKAANASVEKNIERLNNTRIFESELIGPELANPRKSPEAIDAGRQAIMNGKLGGTVGNLQGVVDEAHMGKVNYGNVLKVWWGQATNDPVAQQYAMHLSQLRNELTGYFAATNGRTGSNITLDDKREADEVIRNGIASGSLKGMALAVYNSTVKMEPTMEQSVVQANRQVWGLFGKGEQFDKLNTPGGTPGAKQDVATDPFNKYGGKKR